MMKKKLPDIRLFITDIDGVWTDGGMYYTAGGDEMKKFHTYDSAGVVFLQLSGIKVAVISGENSPALKARCKKLNIEDCFAGVQNKLKTVRQLLRKYDLNWDQVAYLGDDLNDRDVLRKAGLSACPAQAPEYIRELVDWPLSKKGGEGVFREMVEKYLAKKGLLKSALRKFVRSQKETGIIMQARTGSTRLPGKTVKPFSGQKSVFDLMAERFNRHFDAYPVILATTTNGADQILVEKAKAAGMEVYRGSENDVLQRFIEAAEHFGLKNVIRVCADNPFLLPELVEPLIETIEDTDADYVSYRSFDGTPAMKTHFGLFAEAITLDALKKIAENTGEPHYREHVTNYVYEHPDKFKTVWMEMPGKLKKYEGRLRLTLDTEEDFELLREIYGKVKPFTLDNLLSVVEKNPVYLEKMSRIISNQPK